MEDKNNIVVSEELDSDYILIYKDIDNILDDIKFDSDDDRLICQSIIDNIEHEAAKQLKDNKVVAIPNIGTLQKNKHKQIVVSHYKDFKEKRQELTREEYNAYTKSVVREELDKLKADEARRKAEKHFEKKMMPTWINLSKRHSIAYANMWLLSMKLLAIVDFDPELEEWYEQFGR